MLWVIKTVSWLEGSKLSKFEGSETMRVGMCGVGLGRCLVSILSAVQQCWLVDDGWLGETVQY